MDYKMELAQTGALMTSDDYKERFLAEYHQLLTRYAKLSNMVEAWDKGELSFIPTCPREIYDFQLGAMKCYLACLESRAKTEGIELN